MCEPVSQQPVHRGHVCEMFMPRTIAFAVVHVLAAGLCINGGCKMFGRMFLCRVRIEEPIALLGLRKQ